LLRCDKSYEKAKVGRERWNNSPSGCGRQLSAAPAKLMQFVDFCRADRRPPLEIRPEEYGGAHVAVAESNRSSHNTLIYLKDE
jgi:hypothetical protein